MQTPLQTPRNRIITAIHVTAAGVTNEFLRLRDPLISLTSIMQGVTAFGRAAESSMGARARHQHKSAARCTLSSPHILDCC